MNAQPSTRSLESFLALLKAPLVRSLLLVWLSAIALSQKVQAGGYSNEGKSTVQQSAAVDWREFTISPVSNPIFFEDPRIRTEARVIFLYNRVSDDFGLNLGGTQVNLGGADIYAYGAQLRYAVTPRLAIIATNDVEFPSAPIGRSPGPRLTTPTGIPISMSG